MPIGANTPKNMMPSTIAATSPEYLIVLMTAILARVFSPKMRAMKSTLLNARKMTKPAKIAKPVASTPNTPDARSPSE